MWLKNDDDVKGEDYRGFCKDRQWMGHRHHKKGGDTYNFYGDVRFEVGGDYVGKIGKMTDLSLLKEEGEDDEYINEAIKDHEENFHQEHQ
jgi:hypothetical protein